VRQAFATSAGACEGRLPSAGAQSKRMPVPEGVRQEAVVAACRPCASMRHRVLRPATVRQRGMQPPVPVWREKGGQGGRGAMEVISPARRGARAKESAGGRMKVEISACSMSRAYSATPACSFHASFQTSESFLWCRVLLV